MKTLTFRQFVEAMKKNGYRKARGNWIIYSPSDDATMGVEAACAYGQAALNLNVDPSDLRNAFEDAVQESKGQYPDIVYMNDKSQLSVRNIGYRVEKWLKDNKVDLDTEFMVFG